MAIKAVSRLIAGAPDYETGQWIPTLGVVSGTDGSHIYSQQAGIYVRVGRLAWVSATITISSIDGSISGSATVKGLPFANGQPGAGVEFTVSALSGIALDTDAGFYSLVGTLRAGASDVALRETGSNATRTDVTEADLSAPFGVIIAGVYQIA